MMFEIDKLKEMKLLELQEIAQNIGVPKFRQLKKLDLVYQILDVQAANPKKLHEDATHTNKPKRKRILKNEKSTPDRIPEKAVLQVEKPKPAPTVSKPEIKEKTPQKQSERKPLQDSNIKTQTVQEKTSIKSTNPKPDNTERKEQTPNKNTNTKPDNKERKEQTPNKNTNTKPENRDRKEQTPNKNTNVNQQKDQNHQQKHRSNDFKKQGKYRDPDFEF